MRPRAAMRAAVRAPSGLVLVGWRPALPEMRPARALKLSRPKCRAEKCECGRRFDDDLRRQQRGTGARRLADRAVSRGIRRGIVAPVVCDAGFGLRGEPDFPVLMRMGDNTLPEEREQQCAQQNEPPCLVGVEGAHLFPRPAGGGTSLVGPVERSGADQLKQSHFRGRCGRSDMLYCLIKQAPPTRSVLANRNECQGHWRAAKARNHSILHPYVLADFTLLVEKRLLAGRFAGLRGLPAFTRQWRANTFRNQLPTKAVPFFGGPGVGTCPAVDALALLILADHATLLGRGEGIHRTGAWRRLNPGIGAGAHFRRLRNHGRRGARRQ